MTGSPTPPPGSGRSPSGSATGRARLLCVALVAAAFAAVAALGTLSAGAFLGLAALPLAVPPARAVLGGRTGPALVPALVATVRLELVVAVLVAVGILVW